MSNQSTTTQQQEQSSTNTTEVPDMRQTHLQTQSTGRILTQVDVANPFTSMQSPAPSDIILQHTATSALGDYDTHSPWIPPYTVCYSLRHSSRRPTRHNNRNLATSPKQPPSVKQRRRAIQAKQRRLRQYIARMRAEEYDLQLHITEGNQRIRDMLERA